MSLFLTNQGSRSKPREQLLVSMLGVFAPLCTKKDQLGQMILRSQFESVRSTLANTLLRPQGCRSKLNHPRSTILHSYWFSIEARIES